MLARGKVKWGGSGLGGGGTSRASLCSILNPLAIYLPLHRAFCIDNRYTAGMNLRSPIGVTRASHGVRGKKSPHPEETSRQFLNCVRCRAGCET